MTTYPLGTLDVGRRVPLVIDWQAVDVTLAARTGQAITLTRASTADVTDTAGQTGTMRVDQPCWTYDATTGLVSLRIAPANSPRAVDIASAPFALAPTAMTIYADFLERGLAAGATTGRVWQISDSASTGPYLIVMATGTGSYQVYHNNGTTAVAKAMGTAPVTGDRVRLRAVLYTDGSVELLQSINGAAETTSGRSAANALGSLWSGVTNPLLWLGSVNGSSAGAVDFVAVRAALDVVSAVNLWVP